MPDHVDVNDVPYTPSRRGVGEEYLVREDDLRVKLTRFKAGDDIPLHRHTDPKHEKLIVRGNVTFTDSDGTVTTLGEGAMYMCGSGATYYHGKVNEDTIILVIESRSSLIEYPPEGEGSAKG